MFIVVGFPLGGIKKIKKKLTNDISPHAPAIFRVELKTYDTKHIYSRYYILQVEHNMF